MTRLFTIGFTKSSAEDFFTRVREAGVKRVLDVRLHNVSQLAGFAKRDDLQYFLEAIGGIGYEHRLEFAPTDDLLAAYRDHDGDWPRYARGFLRLVRERHIERGVSRDTLGGSCFLCSEREPHHCHRRLVAEYLSEKLGGVEIVHL